MTRNFAAVAIAVALFAIIELQFLYATLDGAMPRVTDGMKQRHADLEGRFDDAMAARDAVTEGAVADADAATAEARQGTLTVPDMAPNNGD